MKYLDVLNEANINLKSVNDVADLFEKIAKRELGNSINIGRANFSTPKKSGLYTFIINVDIKKNSFLNSFLSDAYLEWPIIIPHDTFLDSLETEKFNNDINNGFIKGYFNFKLKSSGSNGWRFQWKI